jgi:cytochrome c oxidase cbb3-type subunit 3/ubiquinol-cytochrome c reductase cytochrome c subunit
VKGRRRAAGLVVALAAALVLASGVGTGRGCDGLPGRPSPPETPTPDARSEALYARHCAGCHGAHGTLGAARPLDDPAYLAWIGTERLRKVTAQGVAGSLMPGFAASAGGPLDEAQVDLLVQGIVQRWGGAQPVAPAPLPYATPAGAAAGDPQRGGRVFGVYCADCHGAGGRGDERGGSVVDPDYVALVSDQALRTAVVAGRVDLGMPGWRRETPPGPLSERDLGDLVAWLASHRGEAEESSP